MYCELATAYSGFRPVQLAERQEKDRLPHLAVPAPAPAPAPAPLDISDRRLLLVLTGLVVILLFVVLLLVVQLSHAQMAMLRHLTWR